ncbi:MAG: Rrf2 family transcriptional regulator [Oceanicaulis sp.]|nr:Rrf2 family transcriptional regulator [Oceanicaulis sp.]
MKLSTKGRYAVMAMADLARMGAEDPVTLSDIASRQEISLSYLEQLFAKLRRAGLVKSVRGPGGGYRLSRSAADTRVADIMLAVEEPVDVTRCHHAVRGCMDKGARCITHDLWDELGRHIHLFLAGVSLDDVIRQRVAGRAAGNPAMLEAAE